MPQQLNETKIRAGAFESVSGADQAIRRLRTAGFSENELLVICPAKFKDHFHPAATQAEGPRAEAAEAIATGGAVGATLGGLALVATVATGGLAGLMAGAVLIGGGAIAGGFSNLIVAKGYEQEADDRFKQAIEKGLIVVGVEVQADQGDGRLTKAQRIIDEAGGNPLSPL